MNGRGISKITNKGFSLIEMSVVIIIIGLITAAAFSMLTANLEITQYTNTKAKLNTIVTALQRFYAANNRLPCPAQGTLKLGDATYGQEIFSGLCDRAVTAANNTVPAGTSAVDSGGGNWVRQGVIPSRALGLPDSMMYDDYGNKFSYAVTEKFTTRSVAGVITVNDGKGVNIKTDVAMVVFSHGRDAKGAYNSAGVRGMVCDSGVHLDKENCDADAVFTDTTYNASVDGANWYDDAIVWADKNSIVNLLPATYFSGDNTGCTSNLSAHGGQIFVTSGTWTPPCGATYPMSLKVLAVGGGGGGNTGGAGGGGGSGYVAAKTVSLPAFSQLQVTVGSGGSAGNYPSTVASSGLASVFSIYHHADGGFPGAGLGGNGGSGGGSYGFLGNGGSNGSKGFDSSYSGGTGQGTFVSAADTIRNSDGTTVTFSYATFSAGDGGLSGNCRGGFGGGGGGIVINNSNALNYGSYAVGQGFGGGGCGAVISGVAQGADGVVYIEW